MWGLVCRLTRLLRLPQHIHTILGMCTVHQYPQVLNVQTVVRAAATINPDVNCSGSMHPPQPFDLHDQLGRAARAVGCCTIRISEGGLELGWSAVVPTLRDNSSSNSSEMGITIAMLGTAMGR